MTDSSQTPTLLVDPIRKAVFSGYMQHFGMDESDADDQADASAVTSTIMEHVRLVLAKQVAANVRHG